MQIAALLSEECATSAELTAKLKTCLRCRMRQVTAARNQLIFDTVSNGVLNKSELARRLGVDPARITRVYQAMVNKISQFNNKSSLTLLHLPRIGDRLVKELNGRELIVSDLSEEIRREHLEWVRCRLEALDKIEIKLREMRELATYAANRTLSKKEAAQVQEWVDILQAEVNAVDKATAWVGRDSLGH